MIWQLDMIKKYTIAQDKRISCQLIHPKENYEEIFHYYNIFVFIQTNFTKALGKAL